MGDGRDGCKVVAAVVCQLDWVGVVLNRAFGIWGGRIADVVGGIAVGWLGGRRSGMVGCSTVGWVAGEVGGWYGSFLGLAHATGVHNQKSRLISIL